MTTPGLARNNQRSQALWFALAVVALAGPLIGLMFFAVTPQRELQFLSAFVPALAAFATMAYLTWQTRLRNIVFGLILAVVLAFLTFGTEQALRYLHFRSISVTGFIQRDGNSLTIDAAERMVDKILEQRTGATGFLGYVRYAMSVGVVVSSSYAPIGPTNQVTGSGVLFYWFADGLIILGGALSGAWWANRRTFCVHCQSYYGRISTGGADMGLKRIGWIARESIDEFTRLINADHLEQAGTLLQNYRMANVGLELRAEYCPSCDTNPVIISAYRVRRFRGSDRNLAFRHTMSADDYHRLTTFAQVISHKWSLEVADEWMLGMGIVVAFLGGILWLYGVIAF